ncbi:G3P acyltransferase [Rickettsiales bacterium Ac37b]|nr:G3P acyltransferase [Rickettsiales bacterium Ac37b]
MRHLTEQVLNLNVLYVFTLIMSYLIGSIPFGLVIAKLVGIKDIRSHGSGNIGATNVLRVAGKTLGLITLSLDMLKGIIVVILVKRLIADDVILKLSMIAVIVGHIFPVWLKGKGGKGVATALASFLAYNYILGIIGIIAWLITFCATRISSLSAIIAFALLPVVTLMFLPNDGSFITILFVSSIVIIKHRSNITRLLNGTEGKIDVRTKSSH